MSRLLRFELRYLQGRTPWDTGITPPEVLAFLETHPVGRAIDLGCGTGTNAITLAQHGWEVVGVDFSRLALRIAHRKARKGSLPVVFLRRDVSRLVDVAGPFDLALDIGCFHRLELEGRARYAGTLTRLVRPGGTFLLYAFLDTEGDWPDEAEVREFFSEDFDLVKLERGEYEGQPSGWFTWQRR